MRTVTASVTKSVQNVFIGLAKKASENNSQHLRRVIDDFLSNPSATFADNVTAPQKGDLMSLGTNISDSVYAALREHCNKRDMSMGAILRCLVIEYIDKAAPAADSVRSQPLRIRPILDLKMITPEPIGETGDTKRKPTVYLDRDPAPWVRMAFWRGLKHSDVAAITGCSVTTGSKFAHELIASGELVAGDKTLLPKADFTETADQFLQNLLRAKLSGEDVMRATGTNPAVSINLPQSGIETSVLKTILAAMNEPNQLADALLAGSEDLIRIHPCELIYDGAWKLRANQFEHDALAGERVIALADIAEAELFFPPKAEPEQKKHPGRKNRQKTEPEVYSNDRMLVPSGAGFAVGGMLATKTIVKLGKEFFDPEFSRCMQYAYFA